MREGHASRTAVLVCMGRAVGHKTGNVPRRARSRFTSHFRVAVADRAT
ncbi:MAG: hypothetical protein ABSE49_07430 [Polyangiaceae bacterium]|jgi:hypothetical protein